MIPNPIRKVLSTIRQTRVQALLMGGQACVLYGAAEFSRNADLAVLSTPSNLQSLQRALDQLGARPIAIPPFEAVYLERGHGVRFRCSHPDVQGLRLDIMTVMRGVAPFEELWSRRTTFTTPDGEELDVLSLPDLVRAKKTQRDKDWPMIRRLVEVNYLEGREAPTPQQLFFWLHELRTPVLLREIAETFPDELDTSATDRPLLTLLQGGYSEDVLAAALYEEELQERARDRAYWQPLKAELEQLRHRRGNS